MPAAKHPAIAEPGAQRQGLRTAALREAKVFLEIFIYLWVLLSLFSLHEMIVLADHGISYSPLGYAFINAIVLGKVMLIGQEFNFARRFEKRRLVYSIVCKSVAFAALLISLRAIEETIHVLVTGRGSSEAFPMTSMRGLLSLAAMAVITAVALVPYFAFLRVIAGVTAP